MQVCWGLEPASTRAGKPLQALSLTFSQTSQGFPWRWGWAWQLQELILELPACPYVWQTEKTKGLDFHPQRELKTHLEEHHENAICPLLKQPFTLMILWCVNRGKTWDFICPRPVFNNNTDPGVTIKNPKQYRSPGGFFPFPFHFSLPIYFSHWRVR